MSNGIGHNSTPHGREWEGIMVPWVLWCDRSAESPSITFIRTLLKPSLGDFITPSKWKMLREKRNEIKRDPRIPSCDKKETVKTMVEWYHMYAKKCEQFMILLDEVLPQGEENLSLIIRGYLFY